MKRPQIVKFMSTDEWRDANARGKLAGIRKVARFVSLDQTPGPGSEEECDLELLIDLDLNMVFDSFGDQYTTAQTIAPVAIGFGFDLEQGTWTGNSVTSFGCGQFKIGFHVSKPSRLWLRVIALAHLGVLDRIEVGLLPGGWTRTATGGFVFHEPELICVQFLPPIGGDLNQPGMDEIREWVKRLVLGQPEKTERYEIAAECLRDLPAPAPEADPDLVLLEAMRELTTSLKENTHELRCLQGKTE